MFYFSPPLRKPDNLHLLAVTTQTRLHCPPWFSIPLKLSPFSVEQVLDGSDVLQQISNLTSTEPSNEREVSMQGTKGQLPFPCVGSRILPCSETRSDSGISTLMQQVQLTPRETIHMRYGDVFEGWFAMDRLVQRMKSVLNSPSSEHLMMVA